MASPANTPHHMTREAFRAAGVAMIDSICDYWDSLESMPVRPDIKPGALLEQLPASPPAEGESWDAIVRDVGDLILPALTNWQSPNFFAYFPANASGPAVLGEMLSAGLGVQGMLWSTSPACTELEMRVLDWLADMIGLPKQFQHAGGVGGGVIQGTASEATLVAMVAARSRLTKDRPLIAYASDQAHSSVAKAARICGIGEDNLRLIPSDPDAGVGMSPSALEEQIQADIESGAAPCFVCATVGTTSTCAIDPLRQIGDIARRYGLWLHVDAAYAGSALVCPEHRWMIEGVELSDSFCFNPHKWLLTNFDCSALWFKDRAPVLDALSITPEYLKNKATDAGAVVDFRDWQIPLGRRFRALKLWFVIRHYGVEGLQAHIRRHVQMAETIEQSVIADDRFELAAPRMLGLVCFRLKADDATNRKLLDQINESGDLFLTHSALPENEQGRSVFLRMAIGATLTETHHVETAWRRIQEVASHIVAGG